MANIENLDVYFNTCPEDDLNCLPTECSETHTVEEQLSEKQEELKHDESAQIVIDIDQNSQQFILTKKDEQLLDSQCFEEYTILFEDQNVSENVNNIPIECENAYSNAQFGETSVIVSDKIRQMRSILKKNVKTTGSCKNKSGSCYDVEISSHDDATIATCMSPDAENETTSDWSSVSLLLKKFSCNKCDKFFNNFVSLCDHQRKAHSSPLENTCSDEIENFNFSEEPLCTENSFKVSTIIKVQNENSTRIVLDYDIADHKKQKPIISKSELLLKEQNEISKDMKIEYCHICSRVFHNKRARLKHLRTVHAVVSNTNYYSKCLDCDLEFKLRNTFRDHLQEFHNLNTKPVMLYFPTKDDFLTWKCNIERESLCNYHMSDNSSNSLRYYCSRSGMRYPHSKYRKTEFHRMRGFGSSLKIGISCPSEIFAEITPKGVLVTYHSTHYGHGGQIGITRLFPAEKDAVNELVSKGYSFEMLMKELKGGEIIDNTQAFPLKRRYLKWVKQAFLAPMYHAGLSDGECIPLWVQKCCSLEECPILLCHLGNIEHIKENFILVIMTEFQKQILLSNYMNLICVDVCNVSKRSLIVISVIDELHRAFPVAYCLCNDLKKSAKQFFNSVREHTGLLRPKYLLSNMKLCIYEAWVDVMGDSPVWLWSHWSIFKLLRKQLAKYIKGQEERTEIFDTIKTIINCKSKDIFACMYENLFKKFETNMIFEKFRAWFEKTFGCYSDKWGSYCRKEISYVTTLHFESIYHSMEIACSKATNQKSMFRLIHVLMKILRNKMMDRILDSFDDDKINLALHAINLCHDSSVNIPEERITYLCGKLWSIDIDDGEKEFVIQEIETCPDHCVLKCKECNICVHMYSCSCVNNMINSNLCRHIHAIAYKFSEKQSSQLSSITEKEEQMNNENRIVLNDFASLKKCIYNSTHTNNSNTSSKNITSTKNPDLSHNLSDLEEPPEFNSHLPSSDSDKSSNNSDEMYSKQVALKKIIKLHQIVKNKKLTDSTIKILTRQLNLCRKIINLQKRDPPETKTSSSIPINAVYVVKPKNSTNRESETKKCVKRFRFPSVEERNVKKFKNNISSRPKISTRKAIKTLRCDQRLEVKKLTHTPLMLVLPNKKESSESNASENSN